MNERITDPGLIPFTRVVWLGFEADVSHLLVNGWECWLKRKPFHMVSVNGCTVRRKLPLKRYMFRQSGKGSGVMLRVDVTDEGKSTIADGIADDCYECNRRFKPLRTVEYRITEEDEPALLTALAALREGKKRRRSSAKLLDIGQFLNQRVS